MTDDVSMLGGGVEPLGEAAQDEGGPRVPACSAGGMVPGCDTLRDELAGERLLEAATDGAVGGAHARLTCARLTWMSPLPDWTVSEARASDSPGASDDSRATSTSPVTELRSR